MPPTDVPAPEDKILIFGRAFSPNALVSIPPDAFAASSDPGTQYIFGNWTFNADDLTSDAVSVTVDGEEAMVYILLEGYCTRTGIGFDAPAVIGYCHFTYTIQDAATGMSLGTISAEGVLPRAPTPGVLTVTGGTAYFIGATGFVDIQGAALDFTFDPPLVGSAAPGTDILEFVDGYVHSLDFTACEYFFDLFSEPPMEEEDMPTYDDTPAY